MANIRENFEVIIIIGFKENLKNLIKNYRK